MNTHRTVSASAVKIVRPKPVPPERRRYNAATHSGKKWDARKHNKPRFAQGRS